MLISFNKSHLFLCVLLIFCITSGCCHPKIFNVKNYGAIGGGKIDTSQALLKAWHDACNWVGDVQLYVPPGKYLLKPVTLQGHCKSPIKVRIRGNLVAPLGLNGSDHVLVFKYVENLTLNGGGSINGRAHPKLGSRSLPTLLSFDFVMNSKVENITLANSPSTHFHLFGCNNTNINNVRISARGNTANTDGIKFGVCDGITITNTKIASGDDCIAILTQSRNINISRVTCGPGHGISIGSLGGRAKDIVERIMVRNCTFDGTSNGVRIKTWAMNQPGLVNGVTFQDLIVDGVYNPILIDQNYCPPKTCPPGVSGVKIKDIKYINIRGTSKSRVAVNLQCSKKVPCQSLFLKDINLKYTGRGRTHTISNCSHARGQAYGVQVPTPCL